MLGAALNLFLIVTAMTRYQYQQKTGSTRSALILEMKPRKLHFKPQRNQKMPQQQRPSPNGQQQKQQQQAVLAGI